MPRRVDHARCQREIAEATWRAIDDLGVDGTSMRAIAERAGCTTGRLTHYFGSREDLLVSALRLAHERAAERLAAARAHRVERDALRAVLLAALPLDHESAAAWRVWLTLWAEAITSDALRRERARHQGVWRALVTVLVRDAMPDGSRGATEKTVDALVALVDGLGADVTLRPSDASARRARRVIDAQLDVLGVLRLHPLRSNAVTKG